MPKIEIRVVITSLQKDAFRLCCKTTIIKIGIAKHIIDFIRLWYTKDNARIWIMRLVINMQ